MCTHKSSVTSRFENKPKLQNQNAFNMWKLNLALHDDLYIPALLVFVGLLNVFG